jgi:hypothetical protein
MLLDTLVLQGKNAHVNSEGLLGVGGSVSGMVGKVSLGVRDLPPPRSACGCVGPEIPRLGSASSRNGEVFCWATRVSDTLSLNRLVASPKLQALVDVADEGESLG